MTTSPISFSKEYFFIPTNVERHLTSLEEDRDSNSKISAYLQDLLTNNSLSTYYLDELKEFSFEHIQNPFYHEQFLQKLFLSYMKQGYENKAFELLPLYFTRPLEELSDTDLDKCLNLLKQIKASEKAFPIACALGLAYIHKDQVEKGFHLCTLTALNHTDKNTLNGRLMCELELLNKKIPQLAFSEKPINLLATFELLDLNDSQTRENAFKLLKQNPQSLEIYTAACMLADAYIKQGEIEEACKLHQELDLNKANRDALRGFINLSHQLF